jgi:hypothetical protein
VALIKTLVRNHNGIDHKYSSLVETIILKCILRKQLFPREKPLRCKSDHSLPSRAEFDNRGAVTSLPHRWIHGEIIDYVQGHVSLYGKETMWECGASSPGLRIELM